MTSVCPQCGAGFTNPTRRKAHLRAEHPDFRMPSHEWPNNLGPKKPRKGIRRLASDVWPGRPWACPDAAAYLVTLELDEGSRYEYPMCVRHTAEFRGHGSPAVVAAVRSVPREVAS